jgi:DNA-binding winged helix-turn-helix (wHTH) protein
MQTFGSFHFDPAERTLWCGGSPLPLTRKAAALLSCLIDGRGSWISKSAIMASVWPDTHVHPDNVKVLVREIRVALGDDFHAPRYIQSEPGRGYMFVAELQSEESAAATQPRSEAPLFINRGSELAQLNDAFDSIRASDRRVVVITGPSGIGKTALADTFIRTIRSTTDARVAYGQCLMHSGDVEPLYPLLDAIERLGREFPDILPTLAERAPSWLLQFPRWSAYIPAAARATSRRAHAAGQPESAAMAAMIDEFCDLVEALGQDTPLILCLDDFQLADAATINALEAVSGRTGPAKLLVLGTASLPHATPHAQRLQRLLTWLRTKPATIEIRLGPLTERNIARYLDARFGAGCVSSLAPQLREATAGNPRLMVAALDGFVERSVLRESAGTWRREAASDVLVELMAECLRPSISRQMDDLDPADRALLECAAIVGPEFTVEDVGTAADRPSSVVARNLDRLAGEGGFIQVKRSSQRGSERSYRFSSPLFSRFLADQAPALQQIRAIQRLGRLSELTARRA